MYNSFLLPPFAPYRMRKLAAKDTPSLKERLIGGATGFADAVRYPWESLYTPLAGMVRGVKGGPIWATAGAAAGGLGLYGLGRYMSRAFANPIYRRVALAALPIAMLTGAMAPFTIGAGILEPRAYKRYREPIRTIAGKISRGNIKGAVTQAQRFVKRNPEAFTSKNPLKHYTNP